jgi:ureidoglycolate hydrolase
LNLDRFTVVIRAFIARSGQGITYFPGVWHHPLIALEQTTDFACVVYEDGTDDDCETIEIQPEVSVEI